MCSPSLANFDFMRLICLTISTFFLIQICDAQKPTEILSRPTDRSITLSVLFDEVVDCKVEYGTSPATLDKSISVKRSKPDTPVVFELDGLQADNGYFYRTLYKPPAKPTFTLGEIHRFHTQRNPGSAFIFCIEADEHLYDKKGVSSLYQLCLENQAKDSADFMISLGDTFGDDHTPLETSSEDMKALHLDYRQYLGRVCHSMPFFFCLGNHEGESGYWLDQTPPNNIGVFGTLWRKFYYPNPAPNHFYSGNMIAEEHGMGLPENYYAFTWGDALFVVLDVYRDCDVDEKPKNWDWTLGQTQYDWFRLTLQNSNAHHKFVFAHHNRGQGRGGVIPAKGCEWGGYGNNGNGAWEFDKMRPGWELPIHKLMERYGVDIFFQGHDHLYAWEKLDGVIYQTLPMPSDSTYKIGVTDNGDAYSDVTMDGSGHLRVQVESDCVTVDYIAAFLPADESETLKNGTVRRSYQVGNCVTQTQDEDGQFSQQKQYHFYPNPTSDFIQVTANSIKPYHRKIEIRSIEASTCDTGEISAGEETAKLDIGNLSSGFYLIRIIDQNNMTTHRIQIIK